MLYSLRLIDGRSSRLLGRKGVSIVFTSPGLSDYDEFLKSSGVEYVMPPWSRKELSVAASIVQVDQDQLDRRYGRFWWNCSVCVYTKTNLDRIQDRRSDLKNGLAEIVSSGQRWRRSC